MYTTRKGFWGLLIALGLTATLASMSASASQAPITKLDLNTATEDALVLLPSVNRPQAKKIIKNRPYATINELEKADLKPFMMAKLVEYVTQPYVVPKSTGTSSGSTGNGDWGNSRGRN